MKKGIKKTAITLVVAALIIAGTVTNSSITAEASPSGTSCMHISVREYWSGPDYWLPITYFRDYCPFCGTEFGRGSIPGGPISTGPSDPGIPNIPYRPK